MNDKLQVVWNWSQSDVVASWHLPRRTKEMHTKKGSKLDIKSPVHVYLTEYV